MCTHLSPVLTVAALIVSDHSLVSGVRGAVVAVVEGGGGLQPAARPHPSPERRRGVCKPTSETREECHHVICWVKREYYTMSCSCH